MTKADTAPTLLQQAYLDCSSMLDGFGEIGQRATPSDVRKIHALWASIFEADRHLATLCFNQFDAQRELFSAAPEPAPEVPDA